MRQLTREFEGFEVVELKPPRNEDELSLLKNDREELMVKSDTLTAFLAPTRAVLSQKSTAPFTARDMKLRKKVLSLYPRDRPTPLPWEWSFEPKFEVAK